MYLQNKITVQNATATFDCIVSVFVYIFYLYCTPVSYICEKPTHASKLIRASFHCAKQHLYKFIFHLIISRSRVAMINPNHIIK